MEDNKEALKVIADIYGQLGLHIMERKTIISPNLITIHYDIHNIERLYEAKNKLKFVSAYLHCDMIFDKSPIAHFSIKIPVTKNKSVLFSDSKYSHLFKKPFTIFAGVDDSNKPVAIHLNKTPHILIAGTTGSGKSVMMNSAICSILNSATKDMVEFYMIDTKRVELSFYRRLDGNCRIATEVEDAVKYLQIVCNEIDERYKIMEASYLKEIPEEFKKVIVVIEELGDLMYSSRKTVEPFIIKIARLGRACGVHLIVATQRPTVDVITGEIKANIGCRFALQTTSSVDSRNILGHNGAEKLRGQGDCLLKLAVLPDELRVQCPKIDDDDILNTIKEFNGRE